MAFMPQFAPFVALAFLAAIFAGMLTSAVFAYGLVRRQPALLAAGLPPHLTLGTNKGQSLFGSLAATVRFARAGLVDWKAARVTFPLAFLGALAGAWLVSVIRPEVLRPLVLGLLVLAAVLVTVARPRAQGSPPGSKRGPWVAGIVALAVGTYDGFFGPGAGTFYIAGFVGLLGLSLARASADAKVANFASNIAAAILFSSRGAIVWSLALPLAAGQLLGGFLGAHIAVRRGDRVIRAVVLVVVLALVVKVARDLLQTR